MSVDRETVFLYSKIEPVPKKNRESNLLEGTEG